MDGINFSIAPQNPLPGMMQSLQFGQALGGIQNQRNMAAQQAEKARLDAEAKAARDAQVAEGFKLVHENPTAENYAKLANMMPPAEAESIRKSFTMLDEVAQQNTLNEAANVFAAFKSGNIDVARNLLDEKIAAYENAGNRQAVEKTKALRAMMDTGPEGAQAVEDFFGITMTAMPGGKDAVDAIAKFGEEKRAEAAEPTVQAQRLLDAGKTEAETNKIMAETRKLDREAQEALIALEEKKAQGIYTPEDAAAAEDSLRKEFDGKQKVFNQTKSFYDVITNADANSIGDIALISTYMKILDPNSVVREGEFATAANAGGVPSTVRAAYNNALGTGKIDDKIRNEIKAQSKKIYDNAGKQVEKDKAFYTDIATRRGLNLDNIIYSSTGTTAAPATGMTSTANVQGAPAGVGKAVPSAKRAFLISKWPDEESKILTLTDAELDREYKNTLKDYVPIEPAAKNETVIYNFGN